MSNERNEGGPAPAGRGVSVEEGRHERTLVKGVVLTHGSMCHGMVDAVRKIAGAPDDALEGVSNDGRGPDDLYRAVAGAAGEGPALIFTDLQTGSCALAARFACRDPGRTRVIFGANLPMLLDFVFHREMGLDPLVERLVERGRSAIRALEAPSTTEAEPPPAPERGAGRPASGGGAP
jgi:mannose/fructose-specific phosphotransferase system component IIA